MKKNNSNKKPFYKKGLILIILLILIVPTLIFVAKNSKQIIEAISFDGKSSGKDKKPMHPKLMWFDDFKGMNNMGK